MVCKGAPEEIVRLCKTETVPFDFEYKFDVYTKDGFRILGLASRPIDQADLVLSEEELEINMNFEGFLFFSNPLKKATIPTL